MTKVFPSSEFDNSLLSVTWKPSSLSCSTSEHRDWKRGGHISTRQGKTIPVLFPKRCFFLLKLVEVVQIYLDKLALPGHLKCWVVVHILLYRYLAVQAKRGEGEGGSGSGEDLQFLISAW